MNLYVILLKHIVHIYWRAKIYTGQDSSQLFIDLHALRFSRYIEFAQISGLYKRSHLCCTGTVCISMFYCIGGSVNTVPAGIIYIYMIVIHNITSRSICPGVFYIALLLLAAFPLQNLMQQWEFWFMFDAEH